MFFMWFFFLFYKTSSDGNVTVSELVFLPVPEDNGKLVTCSVTTDNVAGDTGVFLKDSRKLDVKRKYFLNFM